MAIVISIVLFSALMAAISFYGYRRYARPARVFGAPWRSGTGGGGRLGCDDDRCAWFGNRLDRARYPAGGRKGSDFARRRRRNPPRFDDGGIQNFGERCQSVLRASGLPWAYASVLPIAMRSSIPNPVLRIVAMGFAGFVGYYFPGFMLDKGSPSAKILCAFLYRTLST